MELRFLIPEEWMLYLAAGFLVIGSLLGMTIGNRPSLFVSVVCKVAALLLTIPTLYMETSVWFHVVIFGAVIYSIAIDLSRLDRLARWKP